MMILSLETSARRGSVALMRDDQLLGELELPATARTAQTLIPALEQLLRQVTVDSPRVGLIAVTVGPGSFTGLRIGVMAAKTLAYAWSVPLIGINTLELIAYQAQIDGEPVSSVLDAQRQQFFTARYRVVQDDVHELEATRIVDVSDWLGGIDSATWLTGSGLKRWPDRFPVPARLVPSARWDPQARWLGQLAYHRYHAGHRDDPWTLMPQYHRPSAAEEKGRPLH